MSDLATAEDNLPLEALSSPFEETPDATPWAEPFPMASRVARPRRSRGRPSPPSTGLLPEEPALFPWLARHFTPGEATVWWGPSSAVEPMLEMLYVGSALANGTISLIEGANRFHPYRIGELGRSLGLSPEAVLSRVRVARAFTAHQLVALVDGWSLEARRQHPTLLVAHELPALFETEEVTDEERRALLTHVARSLGAFLRPTASPLLLVLDGGFERFPGLLEEGPPFADILALGRRPAGFTLRSHRDATRVELVRRPDGQRGIEEFVPDETVEVIPWAARSRPTDRRWRSG